MLDARKAHRLSTAEKEELVLAELKKRGKLTSADLRALGINGFSEETIYSAAKRLQMKGKVRFVDAKPYWEVV